MHVVLHIVATLFRGGIFLGMGYVCLLLCENVLEWEFRFGSVWKWLVLLAIIVSEF
jgi:hypothetical protein